MTTTTHYTARPLLASDAPHVARIDAMQAEHPMGQEQIRKMVSKQHIGGLVVENSEGVIVAWCLHLNSGDVLDVVRFQKHIEFDSIIPLEMMIGYILGKSKNRVLVTANENTTAGALLEHGFQAVGGNASGSIQLMELKGHPYF